MQHHGGVAGYHEKYLPNEALPDDEERQVIGALVAISTGVEDVSKLNVPAEVGRRLLRCYDDFGNPYGCAGFCVRCLLESGATEKSQLWRYPVNAFPIAFALALGLMCLLSLFIIGWQREGSN